MTRSSIVLLSAVLLAAGAMPALAGGSGDRERSQVRDCRPYNGMYGYYGNPWCDGGWDPDVNRYGHTLSMEWLSDGTVIGERSYDGRLLSRRVIRR